MSKDDALHNPNIIKMVKRVDWFKAIYNPEVTSDNVP